MELDDPDSTCSLGKMQRAVNMVYAAIEQDKDILVVVDCDCDGMCSSALFINYFYSRFPEYAAKHIDYILHDGKAHGLADICDKILSKKPALLVSPDGATNDKKQQKTLNDAGIDILILDHHEADADYTNEHILVINVQLSEYPNKALTGGGVVYKFVSAFEDLVIHGNQPTEFLDLAAIADIGDMADYREPEIRALVNLGLTNIKNPLLFALAQKNKYTIDKHGGLCYIACAFGMVPFINACCRSGTMTEKELVLEAMLTQHAFEKVESSKRGAKGTLVPLYSEAVTTLERIKRRQTDLEAGAMQIIQERIDECHLTDNAVIAVIKADRNRMFRYTMHFDRGNATYQILSSEVLAYDTKTVLSKSGADGVLHPYAVSSPMRRIVDFIYDELPHGALPAPPPPPAPAPADDGGDSGEGDGN